MQAAINHQKTTAKSFDDDDIHPHMIKRLPYCATKVLQKIFNLCLTQGIWIWDTSNIVFLKKPDKPNYLKPGAYRPITLSSYIGKLFEHIIEKRLLLHCNIENILDDEQEGFRSNRYLYKLTATLKEAQRRKMTTFLLCLNFQKAFDSVWLKGLIVKLYNLSVKGIILKLINSFLFNRKVKLSINKTYGPTRSCKEFGVPQGSVLSPLLFIIFISDMFSKSNASTKCKQHSNIYKYADDGSITVSHEDPKECYKIAQEMCDNLSSWCNRWKMTVNCDRNKTECLIITPAKTVLVDNPQKLTINGKAINYVQNTTVLGVIIDNNLIFDKHANKKLQQCWHAWYKIFKGTTRHRGLNISSLVILFKAVVLTKLFYAAPMWMKNNISRFNRFYSRVVLKISGATHFPLQNPILLAVGLEPLSVLYDIVATKFTLKALYSDTNMRCMILQIEGSRGHPFYHHTILAKKFLEFKVQGLTFHRSSEINSLIEIEESHTRYQKSDINDFKFLIWRDLLTLANDENLTNYITLEYSGNKYFQLINHKKLFPRTSKRATDTKVMALIHGHSLQFNSFQHSLGLIATPNCETCLIKDDNYHRLLECSKYNSISRNALYTMKDSSCIFLEIILQGSTHQITCFRNTAQIALGKNDQ